MKQVLKNDISCTVLTYKVMVAGVQATECLTRFMAEHFITTLPKEQQESATIVPVTRDGKTILLG